MIDVFEKYIHKWKKFAQPDGRWTTCKRNRDGTLRFVQNQELIQTIDNVRNQLDVRFLCSFLIKIVLGSFRTRFKPQRWAWKHDCWSNGKRCKKWRFRAWQNCGQAELSRVQKLLWPWLSLLLLLPSNLSPFWVRLILDCCTNKTKLSSRTRFLLN